MTDLPFDPDAELLLGACGFAAGTLVHTRDALRPIETLAAGDWVLSQPEGTGERAHKCITRTIRHDSRAISRLYFWAPRGDAQISEYILTTDSHQFYVGAYHNGNRFSDEYWEEMDKPVGWRRARSLESHQRVETADGETMEAGMFDRIWLTREPGRGWIEFNPDSTNGYNVHISDGQATGNVREWADADYAGVDSFNERYETPELQEQWGYKLPIHDLEVEEFHTYYVGENGLWVHDATSIAR